MRDVKEEEKRNKFFEKINEQIQLNNQKRLKSLLVEKVEKRVTIKDTDVILVKY